MDETLWKTIANILYKDDPKLIEQLIQKIKEIQRNYEIKQIKNEEKKKKRIRK